MKSTSSFYAPGFTPPSYKVKSSTAVYVDPINFTSQSDVGTYYGNGTKERYLGTSQVKVAAEVNYVNFIPVDYARLNTIIYEPITASTNTLGYGTRMVSGATGPATTITGAAPPMPLAIPAAAGDTPGMAAGYVNFASASTSDRDKVTISRVRTSGDYPTDADNQGTAKILNSILVNRNGPYGWPSWKPMHQQGHPILVNEQQTNKLSTTNQNNALQHWDLPLFQ